MKCDGCTLCCTLFPVKWLNKPALKKCMYIRDNGCSIHRDKPNECSDFNCAYAMNKKVDRKFRPDQCGIVFEKLTDDIFFGTIDPEREIMDTAKRQISSFLQQGFSVVLAHVRESRNRFIINDNHIGKDIEDKFYEKLRMRYGDLRN